MHNALCLKKGLLTLDEALRAPQLDFVAVTTEIGSVIQQQLIDFKCLILHTSALLLCKQIHYS